MRKTKLPKMSLNDIDKSLNVLNENQQRLIVGGGDGGFVSSYTMGDGYVTNWSYNGKPYAIYTGNNGDTFCLDGVNVGDDTLPFQQSNTACYLAGEIRVGKDYGGFCLQDLVHEYGHYLQEQKYNPVTYASGVVGSVWSEAFRRDDHAKDKFEQEATEMGNEYRQKYYIKKK